MVVKRAVYIGDGPTKDLIPVRRVGMKTIWVGEEMDENQSVDLAIRSIYEAGKAVVKQSGWKLHCLISFSSQGIGLIFLCHQRSSQT